MCLTPPLPTYIPIINLQRYSTMKELEEKLWPSGGLLNRMSWRLKGALSWENKFDMEERRHQELLAILTRIIQTPELLGRRAIRKVINMDGFEDYIEDQQRDFMREKEIAAAKAEKAELIVPQEKRVVDVLIEAWEEKLIIGA